MTTEAQSSSTGKGVIYGIVGGIAGGTVMLVPMMTMMSMIGFPPDLFPKLIGIMGGQQVQNAVMAGIGVHFLASIVIGAIFGMVVSAVKKLQIGSFGKGIALGIATGIIAFAVLFAPVIMSAAPQMMNLMKMMNPSMSNQAIMTLLQKVQSTLLAGSLLAHVIYGSVLGVVTTFLMIRTGQKECRTCHIHFKSKDEFLGHKVKHHLSS